MFTNFQLKFIKPEFYDIEIWDDYLDKKFIYITEKILFYARFNQMYKYVKYSNNLIVFEFPFDFWDAPKFLFSNSDIDTQIKVRIKNFMKRLKKCDFVIEIKPSKSLNNSQFYILSQSILENENIDKGKYLSEIVVICRMTENLAKLKEETTQFIVKLILTKIKYRLEHIHESDFNSALLQIIQRIELIPLLKSQIKNLSISMDEFDIFSIMSKVVIDKVTEEFMKINEAVVYFKIVMSSNPYIKYALKCKIADIRREFD